MAPGGEVGEEGGVREEGGGFRVVVGSQAEGIEEGRLDVGGAAGGLEGRDKGRGGGGGLRRGVRGREDDWRRWRDVFWVDLGPDAGLRRGEFGRGAARRANRGEGRQGP